MLNAVKISVITVTFFFVLKNGCLGIDLKGCTSDNPYTINTFLNTSGDIYSPGFEENNYPNNLYCTYTIWAHPGYKIKLTFKEWDIEPFNMCGKDRMVIYNDYETSSSVVGIFCGPEPPKPIVGSRNVMHLLFQTDFLGTRKGFHIHYEVAPKFEECDEGECRNRNCYSKTQKCNGIDDCGDGTDEEACSLPELNPKCGINPIQPYDDSDYYGMDRVIGGRQAKLGSWPWQADLQMHYYYPDGHVCGGTLIHPQWVLTAMHCIRGGIEPNTWRIHLGNHHKYIKDEHEQIRYVERIIIYPGFTGDEIATKSIDIMNDVALMKLNAPVTITDYVRPACLPPSGYNFPANTKCTATGWGITRGTGAEDALKQVELSILGNCGNSIGDPATQLCVGNEKGFQDVCHGDSGGPLACKLDDAWNVAGIVSYGTFSNYMSGLCGLPGGDSVFGKVSNKTKWIREMMERYTFQYI